MDISCFWSSLLYKKPFAVSIIVENSFLKKVDSVNGQIHFFRSIRLSQVFKFLYKYIWGNYKKKYIFCNGTYTRVLNFRYTYIHIMHVTRVMTHTFTRDLEFKHTHTHTNTNIYLIQTIIGTFLFFLFFFFFVKFKIYSFYYYYKNLHLWIGRYILRSYALNMRHSSALVHWATPHKADETYYHIT